MGDRIEFVVRERPDVTQAERAALAPLRGRREVRAVEYYTMGSEARHLLVGPALQEQTRRN